jgi:flagellar motor switch protein FliN/FliY
VAEVDQGKLAAVLPWGQAFLGVGNIAVEGILETPLRFLLSVDVAREMARLARSEEHSVIAPPAAAVPPPRQTGAPAPPAFGERSDIRNIDLIMDIEVEVMVRLGESVVPLKDIQRLRPGSILNLDKETDAPVELVVNDRVIAKGELVVVGSDHFALRITEVETPTERIRTLGP